MSDFLKDLEPRLKVAGLIGGVVVALATIVSLGWAGVVAIVTVSAALVVAFAVDWLRVRRPGAESAQAGIRRVETFDFKPDRLVFAYGSLLVRTSIARTIAEDPDKIEGIPARLSGYSLAWGNPTERAELVERSGYSGSEGDQIRFSPLIAVRDPRRGAEVCGAVIALAEDDFRALRVRERNYDVAEVTASISLESGGSPPGKVMTFLPKAPPTEGAELKTFTARTGYVRGIQDALAELGFSDVKIPTNCRLHDSVLVSELLDPIFTSERGEEVLRKVRERVSTVAQDYSLAYAQGDVQSRTTAFALRPIVLSQTVLDRIKTCAEAAVSLSTASLDIMARNPGLATWAGYGSQDIELLHHARARGDLLPRIARVDMALHGGTPKLFEVNADSPGGMHHLDLIAGAQCHVLSSEPVFEWIDARDALVGEETVRELLAAAGPTDSTMRGAIMEASPESWATYPEMQFFRNELGKHFRTEIIDLSKVDLECREGRLFIVGDNDPIDLVYKRILWVHAKDITPANAQAMADAYESDGAVFVNSLAARMAGNKLVMAMMCTPEFPTWLGRELTSGERDLLHDQLPQTLVWGEPTTALTWTQDSAALDRVLADASSYVLKSFYGFGGNEVIIGAKGEDTRREFKSRLGKGYVAQEYVPHSRELMPVFEGGRVRNVFRHVIFGAYVIGGRCIAVEAKVSSELPINMSKRAARTAVFGARGAPVPGE